MKIDKAKIAAMLLMGGMIAWTFSPAIAAVTVDGQVQRRRRSTVSSTVTLWAGSAGEPKQLTETKSGSDGRFRLRTAETPGKDIVLDVIAKGGTPKATAKVMMPSH